MPKVEYLKFQHTVTGAAEFLFIDLKSVYSTSGSSH